MMVPIAGNLTAFRPVQHVETPSGNHSHEAIYYDHRASLGGIPSSTELDIGSYIAPRLNTSQTGPEHLASSTIIKSDKKQKRRDQYIARRNRLTPQQKEEINARRRAAWKMKTDEERNSRQREARQHMTSDEKEQSSTLRRASYKNMSVEDKEETNMRAQRNAKLAAKRNTPCIESIAMP
uniref:Uncharacterized protein n=1 Tax=Hordeum vulgare subsp. vulgare TaxID=112509 RepID=A0A8I6YCJ5_HORVV